jgi:hypothetical protein
MNCLTYVIRKAIQERRAGRRGGYLIMRRSNLAKEFGITNPRHPASWVPHFLHKDQDRNVTQYVPTPEQRRTNHHRGLFKTWLNLWRFDGVVVGDDDPDEYRKRT